MEVSAIIYFVIGILYVLHAIYLDSRVCLEDHYPHEIVLATILGILFWPLWMLRNAIDDIKWKQ